MTRILLHGMIVWVSEVLSGTDPPCAREQDNRSAVERNVIEDASVEQEAYCGNRESAEYTSLEDM